MAYGKIVADQIQHSSEGTVGTQYVVNGTVKMWVTHDANPTVFIRDSLNNSSTSDEGVGLYHSALTNPMSSADFCKTGFAQRESGDTSSACGAAALKAEASNASQHRVFFYALNSFGAVDPNNCYYQAVGDLA